MVQVGRQNGGHKCLANTEGAFVDRHTDKSASTEIFMGKQKFFEFFCVRNCSVAILDVGKEGQY